MNLFSCGKLFSDLRCWQVVVLAGLIVFGGATLSHADEWQPVTGEKNLRSFMSGKTLSWKEPDGQISRGEYRADGTGTLYSWGATFERNWEVKGDNQICVTGEPTSQCYTIEKSTSDPALFRATDLTTGLVGEIRITDKEGGAVVTPDPKAKPGKGGPAKASATELAAELSNPNTALASLTFKNQFRWFEGDLPDADDQSSYTLLFQPVLPFPLAKKGTSILWRPAFPFIVDQPVPIIQGNPIFEEAELDFDDETGLGDISMDLAYSMSSKSGWLTAFGLFTVFPTGTTSSLTTGRWSIGPEVLIAKKDKKYVAGVFPSHIWDVAGWTDNTVNLTNLKLIATWLPGGGWSIGSNPAIKYDWDAEQWTVPINLMVSKTIVTSTGRPWKLGVEVDYFVEKNDTFGPEWVLTLNVTPVVKNVLADLFK